MRLIDADALKKAIDNAYKEYDGYDPHDLSRFAERVDEIIDNAPTVEYPFYQEAYQTGYEEGKNERPQDNLIHSLTELCNRYCKNCPIPDVPDECTDCICTHIRGIMRGEEE